MVNQFRRGQVERALWAYFSGRFGAGEAPPTLFRTRLKRLLEIDRVEKRIYASEVRHARYAFTDSAPQGQGSDLSYSAFNTFCLAVAYDLLDVGLPQKDVVFFMRHIRGLLQQQFDWMNESPVEPRMKVLHKDRPRCAAFEEGGTVWADCRVFMVVQKTMLDELKPADLSAELKKGSLIFQPKFFHGAKALGEEFRLMNFDYRKALVVELAHTARMIMDELATVPAIRRGRH